MGRRRKTMMIKTVMGTVYDANGATVADATVSATDKETSAVVTTVQSSGDGSFLLTVPSTGKYTYSAAKSGETDLNVKTDNDEDMDTLSLGGGFTATQSSY